MNKAINIINHFYEAIRYGVKDMTVFPGEVLKYPVLLAWLVTAYSLIAYLTKLPRLKNPLGAALGALIITILYFSGKEKKQDEQ